MNSTTSASHPPAARRRQYGGAAKKTVGLIVAIAALIWAGRWLWHAHNYESTDDAYLTGRLHQVSAQVAGQVVEVLVDDNQTVHAGDPVVRMDRAEYEIAVQHAEAALRQAQAQQAQAAAGLAQNRTLASIAQTRVDSAMANLAAANANLDLAQRKDTRIETLFRQNSGTTQADVDEARSELASSRAKVDAAQAALKSAQVTIGAAQTAIDSAAAQQDAAAAGVAVAEAAVKEAQRQLRLTTITAPADGRVGNRHVEIGNRVQAGQALLAVAEPEVWVVANFKETQLTHLEIGEAVEMTIDALPDEKLHGTVDSVAPASGSQYALLPPDNATGNFNKVVQRVPVKITLDADSLARVQDRLRLGLSVIVDVKVR